MCWLCITNAGVSGAPVPVVFLHGWLWLLFLHLHQAILWYNFSNGQYQTQWRQRQEPRVWRSYSSLVSCHQATDQRTLQEGKKRLNVENFTEQKPNMYYWSVHRQHKRFFTLVLWARFNEISYTQSCFVNLAACRFGHNRWATTSSSPLDIRTAALSRCLLYIMTRDFCTAFKMVVICSSTVVVL